MKKLSQFQEGVFKLIAKQLGQAIDVAHPEPLKFMQKNYGGTIIKDLWVITRGPRTMIATVDTMTIMYKNETILEIEI